MSIDLHAVVRLANGTWVAEPPAELAEAFQDARVLGFDLLPRERRADITRWAVEQSCKGFMLRAMTDSLLRTMEAEIDRVLFPHLPRVYAVCRVAHYSPSTVDVCLYERAP